MTKRPKRPRVILPKSALPATLTAAWQLYEQSGYLTRLQPRTRDSYRAAMLRAVGDLPGRPSQGEFERYFHGLISRGELAPSSANWLLRTVRAVIAGACKQDAARFGELLAAIDTVRPVKEPPLVRRAPPRDLVARLLQAGACQNTQERAFIILAATTGLRIGELLGLKPVDYDRHHGTLVVHRQRGALQRKNGRPHVVHLEGLTRTVLEGAITHRKQFVGRRGPVTRGDWIFPWGKNYMSGFLARLRTSLGDDAQRYLPKGETAWHAFRHLFATTIARETGSVWAVQSALGDASAVAAARYVEEVRGATYAQTSLVEDAILYPEPLESSEPSESSAENESEGERGDRQRSPAPDVGAFAARPRRGLTPGGGRKPE